VNSSGYREAPEKRNGCGAEGTAAIPGETIARSGVPRTPADPEVGPSVRHQTAATLQTVPVVRSAVGTRWKPELVMMLEAMV